MSQVSSIKHQASGLTLVELLIVMTIIGLLTTVTASSFRGIQLKSRDARRKHDLEQIQKGLEMYHNDKGRYPLSLPAAGEEWRDTAVVDGALYMKEIPADPSGNNYLYETTNGISYKLFAYLENPEDKNIQTCIVNLAKSCGGQTCNYGVASANLKICE